MSSLDQTALECRAIALGFLILSVDTVHDIDFYFSDDLAPTYSQNIPKVKISICLDGQFLFCARFLLVIMISFDSMSLYDLY